MRWYLTGDIADPPPPRPKPEPKPPRKRLSCAVGACDRLSRKQGLCSMHAGRMNRTGTTDAPVLVRSVTYGAVHQRLLSEHGRAAGHDCADCGSPAEEWSYDGTDPDELTGEASKGITVQYSTDLSKYQARCRGCHRRLDFQRRAS
jgi:hypothetical protein